MQLSFISPNFSISDLHTLSLSKKKPAAKAGKTIYRTLAHFGCGAKGKLPLF